MLTTVAVLCNIQELNLKRYFVLGDDEYQEDDIEQEQLTPKDAEPKTKYTVEGTSSTEAHSSSSSDLQKPDS